MMKKSEFIKKLKELTKVKTRYGWGKFLNYSDGNGLHCDCSGLIKGIIWGYPDNGKYCNGMPDLNSEMIIKSCEEFHIDLVKEGYCVWLPGHIGIYVGNGMVVESTPNWSNGVQLVSISLRNWRKCGKMPWIDYEEKIDKHDLNTIVSEVIAGKWGNGNERKHRLTEAGYNYAEIQSIVNEHFINGKQPNIREIALAVIRGDFGNGKARREALKSIGYDYEIVQKLVDEILKQK